MIRHSSSVTRFCILQEDGSSLLEMSRAHRFCEDDVSLFVGLSDAFIATEANWLFDPAAFIIVLEALFVGKAILFLGPVELFAYDCVGEGVCVFIQREIFPSINIAS